LVVAAGEVEESPAVATDPETVYDDRVYVAEPTIALFHADRSDVRGIMGPVGSGKSVGCSIEIGVKAAEQAPDRHGIRYTQWAIIRATYPQLEMTTLPTFLEWWGGHVKSIRMKPPIRVVLNYGLADGTTVHAVVWFLALDRPDDAKKLTSLELTGAWINEAREIMWTHIEAVFGRLGRFPPKRVAPLTWSGLIMDTNPPDDDHWWFKKFEKVRPANWAPLFRQPGAFVPADGELIRNPKAENVQNQQLGWAYWERQIETASAEYIKIMLCGQYGVTFSGRPVYGELYSDGLHRSELPLPIYRGLPLFLAFDFGNTPACVAAQLTPQGRLHVLREWCSTGGGLRALVTDAVLPALVNEFAGITRIVTGDPAGYAGSQVDSRTCFEELARLGLPAVPEDQREAQKRNSWTPRREAVLYFLQRRFGDKSAFVLDPSCHMLRQGFLGHYQFRRIQVSYEAYADRPEKNKYSHPHDALQYLCMLVCGGVPVTTETLDHMMPPPVSAAVAWAGTT
jgi:hypothetical protein